MSINAALSAFNNEMKTVTADTEGGFTTWFPDEGSYDCSVESIYQGECSAAEWIDGNKTDHDGILIKFTYRLIDDPGQPDNPRSFEGAPFIMPVGGMGVFQSEQAQKRLTKTLGRLKGHLCTLLGMTDCPDLAAALGNLESTLQTEPIMAKVKCTSYTNPTSGKTYNTEYINRVLG